jgi:hypothetical protein
VTEPGSPATERWLAWAMNQEPTRRRLFTEVLPLLSAPAPVPDDGEHLVEPLSWLVTEVGAGARVSTSGTLNRVVVQAIDARYEFNPTGKPPQSEAHVFQVKLLRELAQRLGLVRRKGTTLAATAAGRALVADPAGLWHRFTERAAPRRLSTGSSARHGLPPSWRTVRSGTCRTARSPRPLLASTAGARMRSRETSATSTRAPTSSPGRSGSSSCSAVTGAGRPPAKG